MKRCKNITIKGEEIKGRKKIGKTNMDMEVKTVNTGGRKKKREKGDRRV